MKKQVILLRGWVAKENYKDFYDFLEQYEFDPYKENIKRWNRNLAEVLEEKYDVITIPIVNRNFADYKAWKIVFEKVFPFLNRETIFIGHSLGWTFLAKYFEENNKLLEKTKKLILVAPWFKNNKIWEVLWTFNFDKNLINVKKIQNKITIFGSKDDFLVDFSDIEDFMEVLPNSKYKIFEDRWHFLQEEFYELIEEIKE
jgi:uncharacterized protein